MSERYQEQMRDLARRAEAMRNGEAFQPMGMAEAKRRLQQELYAPNVPPTRVNVTDFDAIAIGNLLAMLADRHTDVEILSMLKPNKVRAALNLVRAAAKAQEGKQ